MAQNKIIFSSYCPENLQERFGAKKLKSSFQYFHPDIPFVLYGEEDINRVYKDYGVDLGNALPCLMLDIKRKYDAEYICHIDADSLVLGKLDKILDFDYEIASCLNNCDIGNRDERMNRPQQLWNLPNNKYVSCGCLVTNSEVFLLNWHELNRQIIENYGGIKEFWMCDQNWMNVLFHSGQFKNKILDPLNGDVFYGASANTFSQNSHNLEHITKEWGINSWQSWFDIEYKENKFMLYGKEVKILHNAGGGNPKTVIKCHFGLFNPETRKKIQEITGIRE